jgi:predicted aspartyl protease
VIKHNPPSNADKAFLAADYAQAESLYKTGLTAHPADPELTVGLVHALLREQKVQEAADAVKAALTITPNSAALLTLRGEVEFRQGEPWTAADSASQSFKLDVCNPRTHLLLASLARVSSFYAMAWQEIVTAHKLDPDDSEIGAEWMQTLPVGQRIPQIEAYLAAPTGEDPDQLRHLRMYLDHLKKLALEPSKRCHLASQTTATEIPFVSLMYDATHIRAFGLIVKLNGHDSRLQIDTGAGGLLVSRSVAQHAGLKAFSQTEVGGIGDQGYKPGYTAYADSIRIGNLEFQDCAVEVMDSRNVLEDSDGLIGMDVFSQFLVTLDYPMRKLLLGPLPPRPGEAASAAPALKTADADEDDFAAASTPAPKAPGATPQDTTTPKPVPRGPYDRCIAPEMKDYTSVYRVGHALILPAALNSSKIKLFILDTGSWSTTISPDAAREVTKVHGDSSTEVHGLNGKVQNLYIADQITFRFAHLSQRVLNVASFDTSRISKSVGMEISGFIGATTLSQLTIHIDYRDGLVKFDYDPNRGYKF